jgi:acyl-[acyl-carrier-protein]-phospholipid O-acyltransferase/long-chain-fatty-acid--[acyl-carrier-protein] ligase
MRDAPRHPLAGLLAAQFLGAFNDNAWKLFVAVLGIRALAARFEVGCASLEAASQIY